MTFETHIDKLDYLLGVHYVFVPAGIVKKLGGIKSGRWICSINDQESFQCGLVSLSEGNAYITVNKARLKKLGLKIGSHIQVKLEKDKSEFGIDICEEFKTLLEQDFEGDQRFRALKPGMQRAIIYHIGAAKSSQIRIDRSVKLINKLKASTPGQETYRALLYNKE